MRPGRAGPLRFAACRLSLVCSKALREFSRIQLIRNRFQLAKLSLEGGPIFGYSICPACTAPCQAGAEASVQSRIRRTFCGSLADVMLGTGRARLRSTSFCMPFSPAPTPFQLASCTIVVPGADSRRDVGEGPGCGCCGWVRTSAGSASQPRGFAGTRGTGSRGLLPKEWDPGVVCAGAAPRKEHDPDMECCAFCALQTTFATQRLLGAAEAQSMRKEFLRRSRQRLLQS